MIKVKLTRDPKFSLVWFTPFEYPEFAALMHDRDIEWNVDGDHDIEIRDASLWEHPWPGQNSARDPLILFDRIDYGHLTAEVRQSLNSEHPPAQVWKPVFYPSVEDQNGLLSERNRLGYLIHRQAESQGRRMTTHGEYRHVFPIPVEQESLTRVRRINTLPYSETLNYPFVLTHNVQPYRSADFAFIGTMRYPHAWPMLHRRFMREAIAELSDGWTSHEYYRNVHDYKALPPHIAFDMLLDAKVALCPWGVGECTFREFEAVMAGCILIKPYPLTTIDMAVVDVLVSDSVVYCRADFRDLPEALEAAVRRFETVGIDYLTRASRVVRDHCSNLEPLADEVALQVKKALQTYG